MKLKLYSNKTGREIKTGQTVTTTTGLVATVFAMRPDRGSVYLQTNPDSNTSQATVMASMIGATFKPAPAPVRRSIVVFAESTFGRMYLCADGSRSSRKADAQHHWESQFTGIVADWCYPDRPQMEFVD